MSSPKTQIETNLLDSPEQTLTESHSPSNGKNRILNDSNIQLKGFVGMILCIASALFIGVIGIILVKISLDQAKIAIKEYDENPDFYRLSSIKMVKRGRVFAYIGLVLFIVEIIALMIYISII